MRTMATKKGAMQINWKMTEEADGTWIARCEALKLTVQLTSTTDNDQVEELAEVTISALQNLFEKPATRPSRQKDKATFKREVSLPVSLERPCFAGAG